MSPRSRGGWKARRSYNLRLRRLGQASGEAADDVVVDAARGEADRVRDRGRGRVAVRDHDQPTQPEKVGASVRVRIQAPTQPPGRRADEEAADGSRRARGDLL